MMQYERFHLWTNSLDHQVTGFARQQAIGLSVEPVVIEVAEQEIDHVWANSLQTDRSTLTHIRRRLNEVRRTEESRPAVTLPIRHILG
jgi:hypothetical protein